MKDYLIYLTGFIRVPAIIILALVASRLTRTMVKRTRRAVAEGLKMADKAPLPDSEVNKRADTISGILGKAVVAVIWIIAGMMLLNEFGFDPKPVLAGAGIVGLAVGFGAQNLVKDIISGLFIIMENQIRVGDVAVLNGTGGLVEAIHLRTTVLRDVNGTVHIFPNGAITSLANMTREFSYYVFDIGVSYSEDIDKVIAVLQDIGSEMRRDEKFGAAIMEPLEIMGLDRFADSAVIIKARIKTLPMQQWAIGREMNQRIKKRFEKEGIIMPYPHRTISFDENGLSALLGTKEEKGRIKELMRQVIGEIKAEEGKNSS